MGHVTIIHMVFAIVINYIYLDKTNGTCYFYTHGVCYCHLLYLLKHNGWDMLLLYTWCLL